MYVCILFICYCTFNHWFSQGSSCVFGGLKGHFNTSGSWKLCYTILFIMFSFTLLNLSSAFSAVHQMILLNKWHQVVDVFEAAPDWFKSHLTNISLPLGQIIVIFIKKTPKKPLAICMQMRSSCPTFSNLMSFSKTCLTVFSKFLCKI